MSEIFSSAVAVTPSDTADQFYDSLFVGGAGNVSVVTAAGQTVTLTGVAAGTRLPLRVRKVRSTGTTATGVVGLAS